MTAMLRRTSGNRFNAFARAFTLVRLKSIRDATYEERECVECWVSRAVEALSSVALPRGSRRLIGYVHARQNNRVDA